MKSLSFQRKTLVNLISHALGAGVLTFLASAALAQEKIERVTITSYFNLVRAHNPGAAFSFLADASGWQRWFFVGLGAVASVFIVWMLRRHPGERLFCLAISLIMGGAIGNVVDRLLHGHVIDFLQFHWPFLAPLFPGGYFPSFNIADAAITAGAVGLILDELLRVRRSR